MLAKCLWKMYSCDEKVRGNSKPVELDDVLDSLLDAIDTLPQRKDSRSDPIFEPHYKLVSIIHKLVHRDILTVRLSFFLSLFIPLTSLYSLPMEVKLFLQLLGLEKSKPPKTRQGGSPTYLKCFEI